MLWQKDFELETIFKKKQTKKQKWYTETRTIIIPWDILFYYLQVKFSPEDNIKTLKDIKFETWML